MYIACTVSKQELEAKNGVAFFPITLIFSVPTIRGIYMGPVPFGGFLGMYWIDNCSPPNADTVFQMWLGYSLK